MIGNGVVLLAVAAVAATGSPWPDVVVGLTVAGMFSYSAIQIVYEATGKTVRAS